MAITHNSQHNGMMKQQNEKNSNKYFNDTSQQ